MKRIVAIGGGHGLAQILTALRIVADRASEKIQITGICGNTDSGGMTKVSMIEYGAGSYLGDLTRCIAALCGNLALSEVLNFRFTEGPLEGWTPRHVLLLALELKARGGKPAEATDTELMEMAIDVLCSALGCGPHRVIPMTRDLVSLKGITLKIGAPAHHADSRVPFKDEEELDGLDKCYPGSTFVMDQIELDRQAKITCRAERAIEEADHIIIAPGSFFGSIIATLLPEGVADAFQKNRGRGTVTFFLSICTKSGEPNELFDACEYVQWVERFIRRTIDDVVADDSDLESELKAHDKVPVDWLKFEQEEQETSCISETDDLRQRLDWREFELATPEDDPNWDEMGLVSRFWKAKLTSDISDGQFLHDPVLVADLVEKIFLKEHIFKPRRTARNGFVERDGIAAVVDSGA